ncbi:hypothetical protein V6N11_068191 [Hibiscus sabdariffa]|uniref:Uncharacterized protein n=1 Tax=Hibiscus sabdariffa TaxID=183260 RepID=A0ABR2STM5_9ROSI
MERLSHDINAKVELKLWKPIVLGRRGPRSNLAQILGFEVANDLGKYLGAPLLHKPVTKNTFAYLLDKMKAKLSGLCDNMEKIICHFVWGSSANGKGLSLVNWEVMTEPLKTGGMGSRKLRQQNMAFMMKIAYQFVCPSLST